MTVYQKVSGSWLATTQYQKVSGSWERATWYLKVNGSWVPVSNVVIDNFEDGDAAEWTVDGGGTRSMISGGFDGDDWRWQHDGFTRAHLAGADAVDRGPQPGDEFEIWFRIENTSGSVINRFEFSADGLDEPSVYRVEWERETGDNEFSIEKYSGGNQDLISTDPFAASTTQTYRLRINWNNGNNNITAQLLLSDGSAASNVVSITDDSSSAGSDFQQPGIYIRTNDNNASTYGAARILN